MQIGIVNLTIRPFSILAQCDTPNPISNGSFGVKVSTWLFGQVVA